MASRRNPEAFGAFYVELAPSVLRFFARQTRQAQVALDLTAETFAKAFEGRRDFRGSSDEQAAGWLWTIAHRELGMYWRHRKVELAAIVRLGLERPQAAGDELQRIEDLATIERMSPAIEELCAELSETHREMIQLRVIDELGYQEIAERLDLSNDVVRARVSRALRVLADHAQSMGLEAACDE